MEIPHQQNRGANGQLLTRREVRRMMRARSWIRENPVSKRLNSLGSCSKDEFSTAERKPTIFRKNLEWRFSGLVGLLQVVPGQRFAGKIVILRKVFEQRSIMACKQMRPTYNLYFI